MTQQQLDNEVTYYWKNDSFSDGLSLSSADASYIIQQVVNSNVEAQAVIDFNTYLALYESLTTKPAMNDDIILQMVVDDLQENYEYTAEDAKEKAPHMAETIVDAMWDQYSHVLEECTNGRY